MEENIKVESTSKRRQLQGVVISNKMEKTIVVETENNKNHPIYKKRVTIRKKYKVDDRKNEASVGDVVIFEECRPLSHDKRFRLVKIVKKGE
ncbi:MAG: 30S ribosomal protein S17 [Candidatus Enterosoma sp.]|nr:30S ribosomal protein S17 [Bacilli bacterium]MDD7607081.1 30S ribosomal protein S17 [bacterium]MDY3907395.1 30S ribosomal protein S17 [Candidatus Enterosoma sp.]MDY5649963.1 30S ribosomal protein S17 [Candidatus Enterosoma sp.]MDY5865798.1 30S ribosomal protein S17 [Candidatus Enterosoma sp.]